MQFALRQRIGSYRIADGRPGRGTLLVAGLADHLLGISCSALLDTTPCDVTSWLWAGVTLSRIGLAAAFLASAPGGRVPSNLPIR